IGYDPRRIGEVVGTMYEMLAGMEPLTPLAMARRSTITPANTAASVPELVLDWSAVLPDRVVGLKTAGDRLSVLTHAGTLAEVQAGGKVGPQRVLDGAAYQKTADELKTSVAPAVLAEAQ